MTESSENRKKCSFCKKPFSESMPFRCKYCEKMFCSEHRLPENHDCEGLKSLKNKVERGDFVMFPEKKVSKEIKTDFSSKDNYGPYYHFGYGRILNKIKKFLRKLKFWRK